MKLQQMLFITLLPAMVISTSQADGWVDKFKKAAKTYRHHSAAGYFTRKAAKLATGAVAVIGGGVHAASTRRTHIGKRLKFPINERVLFNQQECDAVIRTDVYTSCYSARDRIGRYEIYTLSGNDLRSGYIKERPSFYPQPHLTLPKATPFDYSRSGYDRGHIRSHASTAWDRNLLNETYSMVNIWPQTPGLNRHGWIKAEKYERLVARKLGRITVFNIADINGASTTIGRHHVLVPVGFYKVITNETEHYRKCFYYKNTNSYSQDGNDKLRDHEVDCSKVYL